MNEKLTMEDGQRALADHAEEKGREIREAYGPVIDFQTLTEILTNPDFVRFPTRVQFDSARLTDGHFADAEMVGNEPEEGYYIFVHEFFQERLDEAVALVLYHLVTVNYGDFATANDAEVFGAAIMGMHQEEYYARICYLADLIH